MYCTLCKCRVPFACDLSELWALRSPLGECPKSIKYIHCTHILLNHTQLLVVSVLRLLVNHNTSFVTVTERHLEECLREERDVTCRPLPKTSDCQVERFLFPRGTASSWILCWILQLVQSMYFWLKDFELKLHLNRFISLIICSCHGLGSICSTVSKPQTYNCD